MGNLNVKKGHAKSLTKFQRQKLTYDFQTFFDLNKDGYLTKKDFMMAKDKICRISGWKPDGPKGMVAEALFSEIWMSLGLLADSNKDGQISKAEWLRMWGGYKREIIKRESEGNTNYLRDFYHTSKHIHIGDNPASPQEAKAAGQVSIQEELSEPRPDEADRDYSILLDSDEEPLPSLKPPAAVSNEADKAKNGTGASTIIDKANQSSKPGNANPSPKTKTGSSNEAPASSTSVENPENPVGPSTVEKFAGSQLLLDMEDTALPKWLYKYLVYRFNMLDRTGDDVVDKDEYEYVLVEFGIRERDSRQAFTMFTENGTKRLDFDYFVQLCEQYYFSDDPSSLGNFINGKLTFDDVDDGDEDDCIYGEQPSTDIPKIVPKTGQDDVGEDTFDPTACGSTIKLHCPRDEDQACTSLKNKLKKRCCFIS